MNLEDIFSKAVEISGRLVDKFQADYEKIKEKYDAAYDDAKGKVISMSDSQLLRVYENTKSLPVKKAVREELEERGIDYKKE